jgi:agmatinase
MGQERELSAPHRARVVLVPVPYDATTSSRPGARFGPEAILAASLQIEDHDLELNREPISVGVAVDDPLEPDISSPEAMVERVHSACRSWHEKGKLVCVLGGEHSVTVGAARAAAESRPSISFLQIDAHLDLRDSYQGSRYSHACTARRLWELGDVVAVGIRDGSAEEHRWVRENDAPIYWAQEIWARERSHGEDWIDEAVEKLGPEVYVTVDVDGLDSSIMPATGTPVPGGLGYWQLLRLLRRAGERRRVVGFDICELAPLPSNPAPEFTAASILYKMIGYFTAS